MDASTQPKNIFMNDRILQKIIIFFLREKIKKEQLIQRQFELSRHMDESYEEDIYDSYFYEDGIDMIADDYNSNFNSHNKYNTHVYDSIDDFHRGKSSNAKKKSKRSVSSYSRCSL